MPIASPLPPLSPHHTRLLNSFLSLRGDLYALADSEKLSAADLLAWSSNPAVQQHIAALYDLHQAALALAASRAKRTALDTLEGLARTAEDPIERRRAAAAIIRPGSTRDITRPFATAADDDADQDEDLDEDLNDDTPEDQDKTLSTLRIANQTERSGDSQSGDDENCDVYQPPLPHPRYTDREAIDAAIEALKKPRDPASSSRPYFFFLPDATACGLPIPKNGNDYTNHFAALFGHADKLLNEQRHFCAADRLAPNASAYRLTFNSEDGRPFEYHIELTRPDYGDYPKCWRIKSLDWLDRLDHIDPNRRAKARQAAKAPDADTSPNTS